MELSQNRSLEAHRKSHGKMDSVKISQDGQNVVTSRYDEAWRNQGSRALGGGGGEGVIPSPREEGRGKTSTTLNHLSPVAGGNRINNY